MLFLVHPAFIERRFRAIKNSLTPAMKGDSFTKVSDHGEHTLLFSNKTMVVTYQRICAVFVAAAGGLSVNLASFRFGDWRKGSLTPTKPSSRLLVLEYF